MNVLGLNSRVRAPLLSVFPLETKGWGASRCTQPQYTETPLAPQRLCSTSVTLLPPRLLPPRLLPPSRPLPPFFPLVQVFPHPKRAQSDATDQFSLNPAAHPRLTQCLSVPGLQDASYALPRETGEVRECQDGSTHKSQGQRLAGHRPAVRLRRSETDRDLRTAERRKDDPRKPYRT